MSSKLWEIYLKNIVLFYSYFGDECIFVFAVVVVPPFLTGYPVPTGVRPFGPLVSVLYVNVCKVNIELQTLFVHHDVGPVGPQVYPGYCQPLDVTQWQVGVGLTVVDQLGHVAPVVWFGRKKDLVVKFRDKTFNIFIKILTLFFKVPFVGKIFIFFIFKIYVPLNLFLLYIVCVF